MFTKVSVKLFSSVALILAMLAAVPNPVSAANVPTAAGAPNAASCRGRWGLVESCPLPLRFARGSYGTLVNGTLTRIPDQRYYSMKARAGQFLTLSFTGIGPMRGGITFPGSGGDGPFDGSGNTIALPTTGTYVIYLGQNTMAGDVWRGPFTLAVLVR